MKFPSISSVRKALVQIQSNIRQIDKKDLKEQGSDFIGTDVRLQVGCGSGGKDWWNIYSGDSSFDVSHLGYWGCSSISYKKQNLTKVAKDLIKQAKCQEAESGDS